MKSKSNDEFTLTFTFSHKQAGTKETSTELQQSILPATIINDVTFKRYNTDLSVDNIVKIGI